MAVVNEQIDLELMHFPWRNPPLEETAYSNLPAGEVRFGTISQTLTAPGAGNEQSVTMSCELPQNYAYVLLELYAAIAAPAAGATGNNFEPGAFGILIDAPASNVANQGVFFGDTAHGSTFFTNGVENLCWNFTRLPNLVLIAGSTTGLLQCNFMNFTQNETGYSITFHARLARYSINQAYNVEVNTPLLTRS